MKENPLWLKNNIQFARLISELDMVGAFTEKVMQGLEESMDLERKDILELIERATIEFDKIKSNL